MKQFDLRNAEKEKSPEINPLHVQVYTSTVYTSRQSTQIPQASEVLSLRHIAKQYFLNTVSYYHVPTEISPLLNRIVRSIDQRLYHSIML